MEQKKNGLTEKLNYYKGKRASWQYVDYDNDMWTVPVKLTDKRIADLLSDHSVTKIKIQLDNQLTITLP